jgi:prepilin-type N-terminal cleavage/methylation domain-containing protein
MTISLPARRRGFTLIEIMIVVCIIGILVSIAIPAFVKSRNQARKQACIENISQLESAKQQWGIEAGKGSGDIPSQADLIGTSSYIKIMPICPGGGTYDFKPIGTTATCTEPGHVL